MNGEGYWFEVAGRHGSIAHLQDTAFAPLLHFMNSLEPHNVKDDPYNELNMLLKADVGQKNGGHACATDEDLAMEFLVHDFEWLCLGYLYVVPKLWILFRLVDVLCAWSPCVMGQRGDDFFSFWGDERVVFAVNFLMYIWFWWCYIIWHGRYI